MTSKAEQHGIAQKQHPNMTQYPTEYKITSLEFPKERIQVGQRGERSCS